MKLTDNEFKQLEARTRQLQNAARVRVFIQISEYKEHQTFWESDAVVADVNIHIIQPLDSCTCILKSPEGFPLVDAHELIFADVFEGEYVIGNKTIRALEISRIVLT